MTAEQDKQKNHKKHHHPDPWKDTGKWTKLFFYFLVFVAGVLVTIAIFLVVTGN